MIGVLFSNRCSVTVCSLSGRRLVRPLPPPLPRATSCHPALGVALTAALTTAPCVRAASSFDDDDGPLGLSSGGRVEESEPFFQLQLRRRLGLYHGCCAVGLRRERCTFNMYFGIMPLPRPGAFIPTPPTYQLACASLLLLLLLCTHHYKLPFLFKFVHLLSVPPPTMVERTPSVFDPAAAHPTTTDSKKRLPKTTDWAAACFGLCLLPSVTVDP